MCAICITHLYKVTDDEDEKLLVRPSVENNAQTPSVRASRDVPGTKATSSLRRRNWEEQKSFTCQITTRILRVN
ncbi:hypothetical protein Q5P01_005088 [Channa striata]|uniref:Uncharacterized protein n=1 Tax=Channa striata TaxID=64152 RepID=A0AA88NGW9_CHASR|nr:hypothetical protein Q5P01_005088 [Channa striata]